MQRKSTKSLRLSRWTAPLFIVGMMLAETVAGQAQDSQLSSTELDELTTWRPIRRPHPSDSKEDPTPAAHSYSSLTELIRQTRNGTQVESLIIDATIVKQGGLHQLRHLRHVRAFYIKGLTAPYADSVFQMSQQWPHLERLTVNATQLMPHEADPALTSLPNVLQQFPALRDVSITENNIDWNESLHTLAGLKTLRQLEIRHQRAVDGQLPGFGQLPQLTSLRLSGWLIGPQTFAGLGQLNELTLISNQLDTATFQPAIEQLTGLETLVISSCRPLRTLSLGRLKNLRLVELTYNDDLRVETSTLAGLTNLEQLTIRSPLHDINLSGLCESPHLRVLIVGGGNGQNSRQSTRLPDCLGQLGELTELKVADIKLSQLSAQVGSLRRLQTLEVRHCGLDSLPPTVSQLIGLQRLIVYANTLRSLPRLGQLRALREVDVSNNQLTALPDDIGRLTQLNTLNIDNNRLIRLPASFVRLIRLKQLWLSNNQIERLPDGFGKLRKLHALTIGDNQLTELPPDMGLLASLKFLSIGRNRLRTLPASFTKLKGLTDLHIEHNELQTLPADIGVLHQLLTVSFRDLPITELPTSFCALTQLQSLYITDTRLSRLPDNIGALTKLRSVSLANNELTSLPNSIGQWREMNRINLTENRLERLPNGIGRMANLTELIIIGKKRTQDGVSGSLRQLPDSIVHCDRLQTLTIENQPQLDTDDVFTKAVRLKSLKELSVVNCNVTRIPDIVWKDVSWQRLNVAKNQLTELPLGLLDAPGLRYISAHQNRLPKPLNRDLSTKHTLLSAFTEAGRLPVDSTAKPNSRLTEALLRTANEKASDDWTGAVNALSKAIAYAPDSMLALPYGERASLYYAHKQYANALTDLDSAIVHTPKLHYGGLYSPGSINSIVTAHWKWKGRIYAEMGHYADALASVAQAERLLPADPFPKYAESVGSNEMDRGRYLALQGNFSAAESSYRKAIDAYEQARRSHVGIRLKVVEFCLLTGQYDRAQQLLNTLPKEQLKQGYDTADEYLRHCLAMLTGNQTGSQVLTAFSTYCDEHPQRLYWPFTLTDTWLAYKKVDTQKITDFQQLQRVARSRLIQPQ